MLKLTILLVAVCLPFIQPYMYRGLPTCYCKGTGVGDLQSGESKRDEVKCEECSCDNGGYTCSGVGYNGGSMMVEGCTQVRLDGCCYKFNYPNGTECVAETCPPPFVP